ncbi:MAG: LamG domain-containing protein [Myxococcota bacterium]
MRSAWSLLILLACCCARGEADVAGGLVAHYAFDDGPGSTTARDASGNGHDLALRNMDARSVWVTDGPTLQAGNRYAIHLDGKDDFLESVAGDAPPFDMVGRRAISVALWVKLDRILDRAGYPFASQNDPQSVAGDHWGFYNWVPGKDAPADQIGMHMPDPDRWVGKTTRDATLTAGTWHHVAVTWQAPESRPDLFQDGRKLGLGYDYRPMPPAIGGNADPDYVPLRLGHPIHHAGEPYFDGILDEVRIYDRKLTDEEVRLLASGGAPEAHGPR